MMSKKTKRRKIEATPLGEPSAPRCHDCGSKLKAGGRCKKHPDAFVHVERSTPSGAKVADYT